MLKNKIILLLALCTLLVYSAVYLIYPARPGVRATKIGGWLAWFDQSVYYRISDDLAKGILPDKQDYLYGLGYPIISVPFSWILPNDRFLIPDAVIFTAIIVLTYLTSLHFLKDEFVALIPIALLVLLTEFPFFSIEPWNNIVTSFGIASIAYLSLQKIDEKKAIAMGLIVGWVFSARYIDMLFLLPMAAIPFLEEGADGFKKFFLWATIPAIIIAILVLATQQIVFGNMFSTPYGYNRPADVYNSSSIQQQDLGAYDITRVPSRLYSLTIDPMAEYRGIIVEKGYDPGNFTFNSVKDKTPLLNGKSFFIIFAPIGLIAAFIMMKRREKMRVAGWVLGFVSSNIFYLSFTAWHSGWTHWWRYFSTWMPSLVIFATIGMIYIARMLIKKPKSSGKVGKRAKKSD